MGRIDGCSLVQACMLFERIDGYFGDFTTRLSALFYRLLYHKTYPFLMSLSLSTKTVLHVTQAVIVKELASVRTIEVDGLGCIKVKFVSESCSRLFGSQRLVKRVLHVVSG
jgi:hypothetical protein